MLISHAMPESIETRTLVVRPFPQPTGIAKFVRIHSLYIIALSPGSIRVVIHPTTVRAYSEL